MKHLALIPLLFLSGCAFLASPVGQAVTSIGTQLLLSKAVHAGVERNPEVAPVFQAIGKTLEHATSPDPSSVKGIFQDYILEVDSPHIQAELTTLNNILVSWWTAYVASKPEDANRAVLLGQLQAVGHSLVIASLTDFESQLPAEPSPLFFAPGWEVY